MHLHISITVALTVDLMRHGSVQMQRFNSNVVIGSIRDTLKSTVAAKRNKKWKTFKVTRIPELETILWIPHVKLVKSLLQNIYCILYIFGAKIVLNWISKFFAPLTSGNGIPCFLHYYMYKQKLPSNLLWVFAQTPSWNLLEEKNRQNLVLPPVKSPHHSPLMCYGSDFFSGRGERGLNRYKSFPTIKILINSLLIVLSAISNSL